MNDKDDKERSIDRALSKEPSKSPSSYSSMEQLGRKEATFESKRQNFLKIGSADGVFGGSLEAKLEGL